MATAARRDQQLILRNLPCKVGWFVLNRPTSSDKSCHLIPPVLRLKSVVHFDPLISGVTLCAQKAGQGVSATKSGNGLQKTCNIVLSCSYTIFILFFDFSVAFVVREEKSLIDKGFSRD
jgi:hypothetical protein